MERYSLKTQFVLTLLIILVLSVMVTLVTYFGAWVVFTQIENKRLYPANAYENRIPKIEKYIQQQGSLLLNSSEKPEVEKNIPVEGIRYQVLDPDGKIIYGSDSQSVILDRKDLYERINTTFGTQEGRFVRVVPIITVDGKIAGGVTLFYVLAPSFASSWDQLWISVVFILALFSPFIYVSLFTLGLAQRFAGRINRPLILLIEAAKKIEKKDLDFEINYHLPNELGKLCEAFEQMKVELQKSLISQWKMEQEREEIIEALAHDLKTPLSIISGYVEALLDSDMDNRARLVQYLRVIQENAGKGAHLVEQMQYAVDLERTDFSIETTPLDVTAFLTQKVENYQLLADPKNVAMSFTIQDERPIGGVCQVDREKLERILDNIALNGLRYAPSGGGVAIAVRITSGRIFFEVSDNGQGFSKKDLANLFTRFYRGDEAREAKNGHSGLGLYIARQLAEKLDGAICAQNATTGGASVLFNVAIG